MKSEDFLARYLDLKRQSVHLRNRILEVMKMKEQEYNTIFARKGGMPRGTDVNDPVYRACERLEEVYDKKIDVLGRTLSKTYSDMFEIELAIETGEFSEYEREYLRLKFLKGISAAEIARQMNFSPRQITRIRASALEKTEQMFLREA